MRHWEVHHPGELRKLYGKAKASGLPPDKTIQSFPVMKKFDFSTPLIDCFLSPEGSFGSTPTSMTQMGATHAIFDPEVYKALHLEYHLAHSLPFALAESPYLARIISYARRCEDEPPSISRHALRLALDHVYEDLLKSLKLRLAGHKGRFALTLVEWKSGNNYDFLGITLHFHNEDFVLEKFAIGFEVLNKDPSYTGDVLYQHLERVLCEHGIEDRIISITRDNSSPINTLINKFKERALNSDAATEFTGDIRCVGHVLNLTTNAFLSCTVFKSKKSEIFSELLKSTMASHPDFAELFSHMKHVPKIVNFVIKGTCINIFLKNKFRELVKDRKAEEGNKKDLETLLRCNDTSWLSVYRMLERFLYFRPEITKLLKIVENSPPRTRANFGLKILVIEDSTWSYLHLLCDALQLFVKPTIQLQYDTKETSNMTIPYVCKIIEGINEFKTKEIAQTNPLIALGLEEASKKILQYYRIYDTDISPLKDLYIATMLDPRLKNGIFRILKLPVAAAIVAEEYFYKVFHRYREEMEKEGCVIKRRQGSTVKNCNEEDDLSFFPESQVYDEGADDEAEARRYFAKELSHPTAPIRDYYQKLKDTFPTIYRMGKDYLSMMAMSAPSESLFSRVKYIVTDKRNRLQPNTIKMLAVLKARDIVGDKESVYFVGVKDLEENKKKDLDDSMPIHTSFYKVQEVLARWSLLILPPCKIQLT